MDGEKIVAVCKDPLLPTADTTINASGKFILPGCIDSHVHFGLYHPYEQELRSMTNGAICSGTTTMGQMLIDRPMIESYLESLSKYKNPISRLSRTDVIFFPVLGTDQHLREVDQLVTQGICNFKMFHGPGLYGSAGPLPARPGEALIKKKLIAC